MGSALLRAAHVRDDAPPWVFEDLVSARLLTSGEAEPLEAVMAGWPPQVRAALRVEHAVRTRLAEDVAIAGLGCGRDAYVVLGAGLDTFAWRHPQAGALTVWELDHPDTQEWKRAALARAGLPEGRHVRFCPIDLSITPLAALATPEHATWSCLGVTMYIERAATAAMVRAIADHRPGTSLVVNFNLACEASDELSRAVRAATAPALAAVNEPFMPAYTAEEVTELLHTAGFRTVTLVDAGALRARYFPDRLDLLDHYGILIAVATV
jgi:methyltransferase (TIGR00027 family)